ncbi:MAG: DUF1570 domain-containing protein [Planctomycetaceae bacterium]|jgi:hypothetical protein|nr:DUF1570 domain-containing protein [Planctomycetaceae bacterium]
MKINITSILTFTLTATIVFSQDWKPIESDNPVTTSNWREAGCSSEAAIVEEPPAKLDESPVRFLIYETPESARWSSQLNRFPQKAGTTISHRLTQSLREVENTSYSRYSVQFPPMDATRLPSSNDYYSHYNVTANGSSTNANDGKIVQVGFDTPYDENIPYNQEPRQPDRFKTVYSGDTREWAERYAPAHHIDPLSQKPSTPAPQVTQTPTSTSTQLPPPDPERIPKIADISASYKDVLPHVAICGVVVCQSNVPLAELNIIKEIEQLQIDLTRYMGVPVPREKIELCIFNDSKSYLDFIRKKLPANAPNDRRALYYKPPGKSGVLMLQVGKTFEIDLRHEMTHAIIHASISSVPIWLDEGLAKYFEMPPAERPFDNPYTKSIKRNNSFGIIPSLQRLEKLKDINEMGRNEYRDSWAWVHFMIHYSRETHQLLADYIRLLSTLPEGTEKFPSLANYLKERVESPRTAFNEHFKEWKPKELR